MNSDEPPRAREADEGSEPGPAEGPRRGDLDPSDEDLGRGEVTVNVEVPVQELGLCPPPVRTLLRAVPAGNRYRLLGRTPIGNVGAVEAWLRAEFPGELSRARTSEHAIVLSTDDVPGWLAGLTEMTEVHHVALDSYGEATVAATGSRNEIAELLSLADWQTAGVEVRAGAERSTQPEAVLTDHQRRALSHAVEAGYYEVPRQVTLAELADRLDRSPAGLSTLLRRAERRLVRACVAGELVRRPDVGDDPFTDA